MKISEKFKMIGITMLIIVGLVASGKQAAATPDEFLHHLVSTNAIVLGTKDGETKPSYQVSFSNGYMQSGAPGDDHPLSSGQVISGGSPNATCVGFDYKTLGTQAQDFLCVTVRDFTTSGVALRKGDLFIQESVEKSFFGSGFSNVYRAQVK